MGFDYEKAKAARDNFQPRKKPRTKPRTKPKNQAATNGPLPSIPGFPSIPGLTQAPRNKSTGRSKRP